MLRCRVFLGDVRPAPAAPTTDSQRPATPCCPACSLPGELLDTPDGGTVLLESHDPTNPLRAGEVPPGYRWTVIDHYAHRLRDSASPRAPCQVEHALVCPHSPVDLTPSALRQRRLGFVDENGQRLFTGSGGT
ncbi:DUF6083 domain-containing protein [Streptomyces sp. NPDC059134]|uniref:DUF6083 domain-containing protein n=1 Tax=Streptomyces sp. NPDC059134 TaxID=3346738 RepID=UPI0036BE586B